MPSLTDWHLSLSEKNTDRSNLLSPVQTSAEQRYYEQLRVSSVDETSARGMFDAKSAMPVKSKPR